MALPAANSDALDAAFLLEEEEEEAEEEETCVCVSRAWKRGLIVACTILTVYAVTVVVAIVLYSVHADACGWARAAADRRCVTDPHTNLTACSMGKRAAAEDSNAKCPVLGVFIDGVKWAALVPLFILILLCVASSPLALCIQ